MKNNRFLVRPLMGLLVSLSLLLVVLGLLRVGEVAHASGSGTWTPTGSMTTARTGYTTTLLPDGKVLVAGGQTSSGNFLASAELYDPSSGTWTPTGSMTTARYGHTAALLPTGKVLVAGGFGPSSCCLSVLASAELYDPSSGTWTPTGSMTTAREYHTATLLSNGKVLVAGGRNDPSSCCLASAELYDPSSGTWTPTGSMTTARIGQTATLLPNGKVLVAGGYNPSSGNLASAELYNPSSGTWTLTGSMTWAPSGQTATLLPNGKVLVAGGYNPSSGNLASAELYDPSSGTWTLTGSMTWARSDHTATLLSTGKVLVAGGSGPSAGQTLAYAELYDPSSGTWTLTGSMTVARYGHTATLLSTGKVLVAGGSGSAGQTLTSAELYTPDVTPPTPSPTLPPVTGPVSKVWYFAEGRAGAGFDEFLTLGNPSGTNCQVNITYMTQPDHGSGITKTVSVPVNAFTRVTRWVDSDLSTTRAGPGISVAATVSIDTTTTPTCNGIVAERPMYFNAQMQGVNSGSDVLGVTHPGTTFYFADLSTGTQPGGGFYSSYLPILNPGTTAANVIATYYAAGLVVGMQSVTVAANSRGTIFPSQASPSLPNRVSVLLSSSQPIVSERPTYFSGINGGNAGIVSGAADVIGVQHLSSDWLFAEGYTGGRFQENFVLANLDPAYKPASVTITLEYDTGTSRAFPVTVNPWSQLVWNVNANTGGAGSSQSVSAEITSSGAQIAVEREMYFGYNHVGDGRTTWATGGTDVLGQLGPADQSDYSFAEGYTNLGYDEWLTIQNPTTSTETVFVTVSNAVGTVYTFAVQVVGHSRYTVDMVAIVLQHLFHAGDGYNGFEISMAVQSSNGPIVVERPMYWNASGTQGGSDVIGYNGG